MVLAEDFLPICNIAATTLMLGTKCVVIREHVKVRLTGACPFDTGCCPLSYSGNPYIYI